MYFGPMGCRTGFYLIVANKVTTDEIKGIIKDCMDFIINYEGLVIGATEEECGNYRDMNLEKAKYYAKEYLKWL